MLLAIIFIGRVQPIMMVVRLILITLLYSYFVIKVMGRFWFRYALVIIILSGVFVIFVYISRLVPNEEFEIYTLIYFVVFVFIFFVGEQDYFRMEIYENISLELWNSYIGGWIIFMGIILFVVILIVIWIRCKNVGALRVV